MHPNTIHTRSRLIQEAGYSHQTLADAIGVGYRTVRRWAAGGSVSHTVALAITQTLHGNLMTASEAATKLEKVYQDALMRTKK